MIIVELQNQSLNLSLKHHMAPLIVSVHDRKGLKHLVLNGWKLPLIELLQVNTTVVLRQLRKVPLAFIYRLWMFLPFKIFNFFDHFKKLLKGQLISSRIRTFYLLFHFSKLVMKSMIESLGELLKASLNSYEDLFVVIQGRMLVPKCHPVLSLVKVFEFRVFLKYDHRFFWWEQVEGPHLREQLHFIIELFGRVILKLSYVLE